MDPNIAVVLVAIVGIIVPILTTLTKYWQDKRISEDARKAVDAVRTTLVDTTMTVKEATDINNRIVGEKLDGIHSLVNSQLTDAVNRLKDALIRIDSLKALLVSKQEFSQDVRIVDPEDKETAMDVRIVG